MKKITALFFMMAALLCGLHVSAQSAFDSFNYEVEVYNVDGWNDLSVAHPGHVWGYYEHPYGQNGYIEYMVDGTRGEWTRIAAELVSGSEFDLPFDMYFDSEVTDIHTLNLRFTDGLGNYSDMDGLEWEDVRSMSLTVNPEVQTYTGEPQIFVVTVGGDTDYTLGENGEYTNPGTYTYTLEGEYDKGTIGTNTIEFTVDKAQSEIDVIVPESVEYDGCPHGVTVTLISGDGNVTVTYVDLATGGAITNEPTEVGIYEVFVEVAESEFYYGIASTSYGQISIYSTGTDVKELSTATTDDGAWYTVDGKRVAAPTHPGFYIHNGKKYIVK